MFMVRRVNREILDQWLDKNGPDGISKLAVESGVSSSLIAKVRQFKIAPKKQSTRDKLCEALGVSEEALFPETEEKAS